MLFDAVVVVIWTPRLWLLRGGEISAVHFVVNGKMIVGKGPVRSKVTFDCCTTWLHISGRLLGWQRDSGLVFRPRLCTLGRRANKFRRLRRRNLFRQSEAINQDNHGMPTHPWH